MAWLESHGNLARHPKTRRLMQRMGWTLPHTIGNLHLLWYWALEYAPTGDLTKFDPEDLTQDLDLGTATPEQFIEAMVLAGFLDRNEDDVLRIHDWPDYTAKSLRPKFRRNPEKWHNVLRSYGRPVIIRVTRRRGGGVPATPSGFSSRHNVSTPEPAAPSSALHEPKLVANALRAVPYIAQADSAIEPDSTSPAGNAPEEQAAIPESLATQPGFSLTWWPKFQEMYKNQGSPLDAWEQTQALAKLAENPSTAVQTLKNSIKTLTARPDLAKRKPVENTS